MATLSANKITAVSQDIDLDEIMQSGIKQFLGCTRMTHDPALCPEECQIVMRSKLGSYSDCLWDPANYPEGTFLSIPFYTSPPLTHCFGDLTLQRLGRLNPNVKVPCDSTNEVPTETLNVQSLEDSCDRPAFYCTSPKSVASPNSNYEVPTAEGHLQEARKYGLAPVIEAGKSAGDLSEKVSIKNESMDCDVDSERESFTAAQMGEIGSSKMPSSKRDDCPDEDAKQMKKRKRSQKKRISEFEYGGGSKKWRKVVMILLR